MKAKEQGIYIISPSGVLTQPQKLITVQTNLRKMGFKVMFDKDVSAKDTRFAGTDDQRVAAIERSLKQKCEIVMASRGGYGLTRILSRIDWKAVAESGKKFVGYSDFTAFNLALLSQTETISYTGPLAIGDFGVAKPDGLTQDLFCEMLNDELEVLSFECPDNVAVDCYAPLWGGNLSLVCTLLGTPYFPNKIKGILILEDVNVPPYQIERMLIQLLQAGVLQKQKAIVLGDFTDYKVSPLDKGYDLNLVLDWLRKECPKTPIITGLPYGHGKTKATLPIGQKVGLATEDGMAYLVFEMHHHD